MRIGIVYGTRSGIMMRVVVPDNDRLLDDPKLVNPGESILRVSILEAAAAVLERYLGFRPHSGRAAVVANGVVERVIVTDPDLYSEPGKQVVLCHDKVRPGYLYTEASGFVDPVPPASDKPVASTHIRPAR